MPGAII
jgi:hypothetical protein